MKVVLFCGGLGMRMRDSDPTLPKPMVTIGNRPIMWHVMRYYAHFGHREFILCLGHGAESIKRFFLDYEEELSNDFVLEDGGKSVRLLGADIDDWSISFVDTGVRSPIGERLRRVRHLIGDDEMFLANYADVLTDAPLDEMVEQFRSTDDVTSMMAVPPQAVFHCVELTPTSQVTAISSVSRLPIWMNGGYFCMRPEIFEYLTEDCDLIEDTCVELTKRGRVSSYPYMGFWHCVDTAKERAALEEMFLSGNRPWMLWEKDQPVARDLTAD